VIPAAHIHGEPALGAWVRAARRWRRESAPGRVLTWSASLGAVQAALLVAIGGTTSSVPVALAVLALVFTTMAALAVGTAWLLRLAIPIAPRAIGAIVPILFYTAAVFSVGEVHALFAASLLAPAVAWAPWLPRGTFRVARRT